VPNDRRTWPLRERAFLDISSPSFFQLNAMHRRGRSFPSKFSRVTGRDSLASYHSPSFLSAIPGVPEKEGFLTSSPENAKSSCPSLLEKDFSSRPRALRVSTFPYLYRMMISIAFGERCRYRPPPFFLVPHLFKSRGIVAFFSVDPGGKPGDPDAGAHVLREGTRTLGPLTSLVFPGFGSAVVPRRYT